MLKNALWIRAGEKIGTVSPYFRTFLTVKPGLAKATVRMTARGVFDLMVNGQKFGDACLAPGWTSEKRAQVWEYDITDCLREGENAVGALCASGWVCGRITYKYHDGVPDHPSVIGDVTLTYADGSVETVCTDETWDVFTSEILFADIYDGETCDLTADIRSLGKAVRETDKMPALVPQVGLPVRPHEHVAAAKFFVTPKGERVIDFGQNLAGYPIVHTNAPKGTRFAFSVAEVLDKEGNFYTENYRSAKNDLLFVTDGKENVWHPRFTFQGFRYLRLDEAPEDVKAEDFEAVALYSDMERIGDFHCGNEKINQLYQNILWGQRSNFVDVPTDCPQRDERLGWTGDAEVFCRTACLNYRTHDFFRKWLGDMALDQLPDGGIPSVIPSVFVSRKSAAWGDAACVCPMEVYLAYGDKEMLRQNFPMMKEWVRYMHEFGREEFLWLGDSHYGDWLALDAGYGAYIGATQTDLIASAFFAYSTSLCIRAGKILGEDVSCYEELYRNVRAAFREAFMENGLPCMNKKGTGEAPKDHMELGMTQTSIVLILRFGLCEDSERPLLLETLRRMIRENDGRMTTGFVGTPYILHVLSDGGKVKEAYDLLLSEKSPSWLYSVNRGATTMWEHWDGINDEGGFWSADMNSFNHYAYGAVYDWIFGVAAGVQIPDDGAGYRRITVKPQPDERLGHLYVSVRTDGDLLSVGWRYTVEGICYDVRIPAGTVADLTLPDGQARTLTAGNYQFHTKK